MVLSIQIAGFLFGLFMIYYSFLNYKRKEFTVKEVSFWILVWIVFLVVAIFPQALDPISRKLAFARKFDLLVITWFMFLTVAIFYSYTITRKTQKQLESIVRSMAIKRKK